MLWKIIDMDGNGCAQMEWIVYIGKLLKNL